MSETPQSPSPEQPDHSWRVWRAIAGAARCVRDAMRGAMDALERSGLPEGLTLEDSREIMRLWDEDCVEITRRHGGLSWETRDAQMRSLEAILQLYCPHLMQDELQARCMRAHFQNKRLPQAG